MRAIREKIARRTIAARQMVRLALVISMSFSAAAFGRCAELPSPMVEVDLVSLDEQVADEQEPVVPAAIRQTQPVTPEKKPEAVAPGEPEVLPVAKPIAQITTSIRPEGEVPPNDAARVFNSAIELDADGTRGWSETLFFWQASNLVHNPLYFEQRYVERYGYNFGPAQPAASAAQFYGSVPLLPLKMLRHPPREQIYALEPARPGSFGTRRPRW